MSAKYQSNDDSGKWEAVTVCVFFLCLLAYYVIGNMMNADRFAQCAQLGGEMRKIDGEVQCRVPPRRLGE